MLNIVVERFKKSYDYKADPNKPGSFSNNWKNNCQDWFVLYDDDCELIRVHCQSVANYNWGDYATADTVEYGDTISEGFFKMKCFVEPRGFAGEIHGITATKDVDGQWIDKNSYQTTANGFQNGRFLVHSNFSKKINGDTNFCWSAGCFVMSSDSLKALNDLLHAYNVKPGDLIDGQVVEEEENGQIL